ncbi:MAG: NYN domain-containing protein, partial [Massilia sp.]
MNQQQSAIENRVAVLVDCDNTTPVILEFGLRMVAQFGRVVLRRGYGNHTTLTNKWQEALVRLAFTPCLQFQYAPGKNTADIALALDALEAMFDKRAESFCVVTSDSDFAYLCRKLRERGARVYIVGESKTPAALRNASDEFFEWTATPVEDGESTVTSAAAPASVRDTQPPPAPHAPAMKRRPKFIVEAVRLLSRDSSEGKVALGTLGQYLKRTDPAFTPTTYGHAGLLDMIKNYELLVLKKEDGG